MQDRILRSPHIQTTRKHPHTHTITCTAHTPPPQPPGVSNARAPDIQSIAAGFDHSLALKRDGTVWGTGWNGDGQLGDGTNTGRTTFALVKDTSGR